MGAFKELNITRFRGIKDLSLKEFGDVNIFVGNNNYGKTSILEAIRLFNAPDDIQHIVWSSRSRILPRMGRGDSIFNAFLTIFPNSLMSRRYNQCFVSLHFGTSSYTGMKSL